MAQSQYSNSEGIDSEIQLADSGYGQGEVLVNPLHLAALYTGFANNGNVISPYLLYKGNPEPKIWLEQAYTPEAAQLIEKGLMQVISSPHGTGYGARREDISLAGKTGTAEIKLSKDETGIWFTAGRNFSRTSLVERRMLEVLIQGWHPI